MSCCLYEMKYVSIVKDLVCRKISLEPSWIWMLKLNRPKLVRIIMINPNKWIFWVWWLKQQHYKKMLYSLLQCNFQVTRIFYDYFSCYSCTVDVVCFLLGTTVSLTTNVIGMSFANSRAEAVVACWPRFAQSLESWQLQSTCLSTHLRWRIVHLLNNVNNYT